MDWLDLLAVQGTLKSLLQHHSSKASILRHSAFYTVQLSHPYVTTGKTIALIRLFFFFCWQSNVSAFQLLPSGGQSIGASASDLPMARAEATDMSDIAP